VSPLDIVCSYVAKVNRIAHNFISEFGDGANERVIVYETSLEQLNDIGGVVKLFEAFNLTPDWRALENIVGKQVNTRDDEKAAAASHEGRVISYQDADIMRGLKKYDNLLSCGKVHYLFPPLTPELIYPWSHILNSVVIG